MSGVIPRSRRVAVLDAASNLGLRPPSPDHEPGTARMATAVRALGLLARLDATDAGAVDCPPYRAEPEDQTGFRNGHAIAQFTRDLADRLQPLLDNPGTTPLVLGGDCSVLLGPMLALRRRGRYGLVFVDAHDDYSPPRHEEKYAGLFAAAGMDLGLATGHFSPLLSDLDQLGPYVAEQRVVHVGLVREPGDHDYGRTELFDRSGITSFPGYEVRARGAEAVAEEALAVLRSQDLDGFWVHVDVDVLDQAVMPAVDSPNPSGLTPTELTVLLRRLACEPSFAGFDFTIYDPDLDPDRSAARVLIEVIVGALEEDTLSVPRLSTAHLLVADDVRPELAEQMRPFDRLIGSWSLRVTNYLPDGTTVVRTGEWHFSWALDGRAVMDVWITPDRASSDTSREWGVTVRIFDPSIGAWRSTWHGPKHGAVLAFIGRLVDDGIVLEGEFEIGLMTRWIFSDIAERTFHWRAEEDQADGTVRVVQTMEATRVSSQADHSAAESMTRHTPRGLGRLR